MRKNEPDPTLRVAGPVPFYNSSGALATGLTFTAAGETAIFNLTSGTFTDTTADAVEAATTGMYYVQLQQPETNHNTFLIVRLSKAGYDAQYFVVPIDNTPDVNVVSMSTDAVTAGALAASAVTEIQSGLATAAALTAAQSAIIAAIPSATTIRDAVLNALLEDHTTVGSIADGIALAAGLLQGNYYVDNVDNTNANGQTAARLRLFRNAAALAGVTAGGSGEGEFATFLVETTYEGFNKIATHKVVRQ